MSTLERAKSRSRGGDQRRRGGVRPAVARSEQRRGGPSYVRSAHVPADFVRDGRPEVAFVGRSNVGKSSLLNALAGSRKLARVGSTPGRTRAVNYFLIDQRYYLVDLPGYGYARVGRDERQRVGRIAQSYLEQDGGRRRVVLLVDGQVGATPLDRVALEFLSGVGADVVVAATKADRVARGARVRQERSIREALGLSEEMPLVFVSARTGEGLDQLRTEIALF